MSQKQFSPEPIIIHLRHVDIICSQGKKVTEAARQIGVTEQTHRKWLSKTGEYVGRMNPDNKVFFDHREQALDDGYRPCKVCNP